MSVLKRGSPPRPGPEPASLPGLAVPEGLPRTILAFVGENENGVLREHSQALMDSVAPYGFAGHVIDLGEPGWPARLSRHCEAGVLLAWGAAGVGSRLGSATGPLWDALRVPFISVMADSPCQMPDNHRVASAYVANGYLFRDWLDIQRRLVRAPQLSAMLPHGVACNPHRDRTPWSRRPRRMVFVKTGCAPETHRRRWEALPGPLHAVLEDTVAAALAAGVGDISDILLRCLDHHDLAIEGRPDLLFGLMLQADQCIRDTRSTAMVQALLDLPVDVVGRGWDHLRGRATRARFHDAVDASALPGLYAETQFLLNTMPNFSHGTHERVLNGFAARCVVVTNENADMRRRFAGLPTYAAVSTEAADLAERLRALHDTADAFDDRTQPALDLVEAEHSAAEFMRGLIELSLVVRAAALFGQPAA